MRVVPRVFLISILAVSCLLSAVRSVRAAGEFTTGLASTYTVLPDGTTRVTQVFTLTNNFSTMYATQYALEIASTQVSNVRVESNGTLLEPKMTPTTSKTTVSFVFPDKVVGKDQSRTFSVSYTTPDITTKTGNVLEVSVPKLANPTEFASYTVTIDVPAAYGKPTLTQPPQFSQKIDQGRSITIFDGVGQATGISALFGSEQIAQLDLSYHLENPKTSKGIMQIALPSDGTYQRIYYTSIDPLPQSITQDPDGNWIASYDVGGNQRIDVRVLGYAIITLTPQPNAQQLGSRPGKEYLAAQPYWPVTDPNIQKLAKELKTPRAIYDYVVGTLRYDYARLETDANRRGASQALTNPTSAICLEFTDLFVTLARAAGIPAREINGYAFTQNDTLKPLSLRRDVLHAWPEYWDDTTARWIAIDPTWANTTGGVDYFSRLDFNHIAFVTHGRSSEYPYSVGVYKFAGQESKDVSVEFVTTRPEEIERFEASLRIRPKAILGMADTYSVILRNNALHAVYGTPYTIRRADGAQSIVKSGNLTLPPLGSLEVGVQLGSTNLFSDQETKLITKIGSTEYTHDISIQSTLTRNLPLILLICFVGVCAGIIAYITWRLLVPRSGRGRPVRRQSKEPQKATHAIRPPPGPTPTDPDTR